MLLNEREQYWIKELNCFLGKHGLNCNGGGNGNVGRVCSEETKKKISLGNLGKPWTEARRLAQKNKNEIISDN